MTNREYCMKLEDLAEHAMLLVKTCQEDKTRIDDALWQRLCELYRELEDFE